MCVRVCVFVRARGLNNAFRYDNKRSHHRHHLDVKAHYATALPVSPCTSMCVVRCMRQLGDCCTSEPIALHRCTRCVCVSSNIIYWIYRIWVTAIIHVIAIIIIHGRAEKKNGNAFYRCSRRTLFLCSFRAWCCRCSHQISSEPHIYS